MLMYAVRHGQSEANAGRVHSGWAQVPLTEEGIRDAELAGCFLRERSIERVIASDLLRAVQTAQIALPSVPLTLTSRIREIHVGSLSSRSAAECHAQYGEDYLINKKKRDFTSYGGENWAMLSERVRKFQKETERFAEENIAVFTHEGPLRAMLEAVLDCRIDPSHLPSRNGMIAVFEWTGAVWRLRGWNVTGQ